MSRSTSAPARNRKSPKKPSSQTRASEPCHILLTPFMEPLGMKSLGKGAQPEQQGLLGTVRGMKSIRASRLSKPKPRLGAGQLLDQLLGKATGFQGSLVRCPGSCGRGIRGSCKVALRGLTARCGKLVGLYVLKSESWRASAPGIVGVLFGVRRGRIVGSDCKGPVPVVFCKTYNRSGWILTCVCLRYLVIPPAILIV